MPQTGVKLKGYIMSYDLYHLNMESLQEMYAFKFYKVYHTFPRGDKLQTNKQALIWQIKLLSRKETLNEPVRP